jgi:hypothetical protein
MSLLDPRFKYVPATSTDITATWRRHGFDARWNTERRARLQAAHRRRRGRRRNPPAPQKVSLAPHAGSVVHTLDSRICSSVG